MASNDVRLQHRAPRCFDSQKEWNLYRKTSVYSADMEHTYCTDCTPLRQLAMLGKGRCEHPETKFIVVNKVIIGRRTK